MKVSRRCEKRLAGFVVLISIILVPILILMGTLVCNNACERYKLAVENGQLETSRGAVFFSEIFRMVWLHPLENVVLCGLLLVSGFSSQKASSVHRKPGKAVEVGDPTNLPRGFFHGVHNIA